MNKNNSLKREELEFYLKNGLFEKVIIPCIFRNNTVIDKLIIEIQNHISGLNYFPASISITIDSLKPHEMQTIPTLMMTQIGAEVERFTYQIIPDFIIRIKFLDTGQSIMIPGEVEGRLSTHIYWQSFLYSTYIGCYLERLEMPIRHILRPPLFIIYLFDNQNIRTNIKNRF
ncbi:MAG: hypothetical protein ACTSPY_17305, partial [Candidatus Helarchaeota archaeon]